MPLKLNIVSLHPEKNGECGNAVRPKSEYSGRKQINYTKTVTIMAIFLWLFQFISPFALIIGLLYLVEDPSTLSLIIGGVSAVVGLIVGIIGWADTVPPRWFWIKSSMDLAGSRFMTAIGYAIQFFFLALAIFGLVEYFG